MNAFNKLISQLVLETLSLLSMDRCVSILSARRSIRCQRMSMEMNGTSNMKMNGASSMESNDRMPLTEVCQNRILARMRYLWHRGIRTSSVNIGNDNQNISSSSWNLVADSRFRTRDSTRKSEDSLERFVRDSLPESRYRKISNKNASSQQNESNENANNGYCWRITSVLKLQF